MSGTIQSFRKEAEIKDQFITVYDGMRPPIEILCAKDGNMPLSFLERRFPGVFVLEYINEKTGRRRDVMFDEEKKAFLAPSDGWGGRMFTIIYKDRR